MMPFSASSVRSIFTRTTIPRTQPPRSLHTPRCSRIRHIPERSWQTARSFHSSPHRKQWQRQGFRYSRFQASSNAFQRWAQRPTFYYEVGGVGATIGGFYLYNVETVPVSGRRRFNVFGPDFENSLARSGPQDVLNETGGTLLSDRDPRTRQVKRVLARLIPLVPLNVNWEIYVVDSPLVNAMVAPGGKVFVFTGILPFAQGDDGLAAILGHEISHAVAHHVSEKMSGNLILIAAVVVADALAGLGGLSQIALTYFMSMPNSRKQETEADYLGLLLMSQACYDPKGAVKFWQRMAKQDERGRPPQFLSTHPASAARVEKIKEWLPEAEAKREASQCAGTSYQLQRFQSAVPELGW